MVKIQFKVLFEAIKEAIMKAVLKAMLEAVNAEMLLCFTEPHRTASEGSTQERKDLW